MPEAPEQLVYLEHLGKQGSAQPRDPLEDVQEGWGAAWVPELIFTLRVCTPHLQGLRPQGNQWAPLLERGAE